MFSDSLCSDTQVELKNRNSLIQPNVCLKQLSDNYQLAGNRKATSFVTVSGLSMNKANFYCRKKMIITFR